MEIVLGFIGVMIALAVIVAIIEAINDWRNSINWGALLGTLIIGGIALAVLFSFTAEGVLVIVGAYIVLVIGSLFMGAFKN